jgi:tetratricopeptide (TPR) repeat protein
MNAVRYILLILVCSTAVTSCRKARPDDAWQEYRSGRFERAIESWRSVIDDHPLSGEAYYGLALAQLSRGDKAGAERSLERGLEMIPDNSQRTDGYVRLSDLYIQRHSADTAYLDAAGRMADTILSGNAVHFDALRIWGEVARLKAQLAAKHADLPGQKAWLARSTDYFRRANAVKAGSYPVLLGLALNFEENGDDKEAAQLFERSLPGRGSDRIPITHLLGIYHRLGDTKGAVRIIETVVSDRPVDPKFVLSVAQRTLDLKRLDLFRRAAAGIRSQDDAFRTHRLELAAMFERAGMDEEARAELWKGEKSDRTNWHNYRTAQVKMLVRHGRIAEAAELFVELQKKNGDDPAVGTISAALLARQGRTDEALSTLHRVISANGLDVDAYVEMARLYRANHNHAMAITMMVACTRAVPGSVRAQVALAEAYFAAGQKKAAEMAAAAALERDPINADAERIVGAAKEH